jgi:MoxR-like ATPase
MHTERHMFPGNNTSRGFYSYYPYIVPYSAAEHIYILKGGPGVGKSTFMRRIAEKAALLDFDIEFMHCSSDPDSLDAVFIPQKIMEGLDLVIHIQRPVEKYLMNK